MKKIDFQKKRDFGQKIGDAFAFVKQNLSGLIASILRLAGLPILIFVVAFVAYMLFAMPTLSFDESASFEAFGVGLIFFAILAAVFGLFIYALFYAAIYEYILLYIDNEEGQILVNEVVKNARKNLGKHIFTVVSMILFAIVGGVVSFVVLGLLAPNLPGFLSFILGICIIFPMIYFMIMLTLYLVVRFNEDINPLDGLSRTFFLISGKWWSTFGLIFIFGLINMVMSYSIYIPYIVLTKFVYISMNTSSGDYSLIGIAITILLNIAALLVSLLVSVVLSVALAFQYYNLVELKESRGLMRKIQTVGVPQQAQQEEEEDY